MPAQIDQLIFIEPPTTQLTEDAMTPIFLKDLQLYINDIKTYILQRDGKYFIPLSSVLSLFDYKLTNDAIILEP